MRIESQFAILATIGHAEQGGPAHTETITEKPHQGRLQQDHANNAQVAHAHGLECAKLADVFKRE